MSVQNYITETFGEFENKLYKYLESSRVKESLTAGGFAPGIVKIRKELKYMNDPLLEENTGHSIWADSEKVPKGKYFAGVCYKILLQGTFRYQIHIFISSETLPEFSNTHRVIILNYDSERAVHHYPEMDGCKESDGSFFGECSALTWFDLKQKINRQIRQYWELHDAGVIYSKAKKGAH